MTTVYLILAVVVLAGISGLLIKKVFSQRKVINKADKVKKKEEEALNNRAKIEEDFNEKQADILSSVGADHGVLPDGEIREHNHAHNQPCTQDCPAYTGS